MITKADLFIVFALLIIFIVGCTYYLIQYLKDLENIIKNNQCFDKPMQNPFSKNLVASKEINPNETINRKG